MDGSQLEHVFKFSYLGSVLEKFRYILRRMLWENDKWKDNCRCSQTSCEYMEFKTQICMRSCFSV